MSALWDYFNQNSSMILVLCLQQLRMALIAVGIGVAISVPVGIYIVRHKKFVEPVLWVTNAFQTIPQLALLGIFLIFFGLGAITGVFVLVFYMLMPIIRATYVGISSVDTGIIEVGKGMGMTENQILFKVQLPIALPIIMMGLRLAMIIAVGGTTIMSLVGAGGLGQLIFTGMQNLNNTEILMGGALVAIETIVVGVVIDIINKVFTSRGLTS